MEVVEWAMPSLMRMFSSDDDVIRFEPSSSGDETVCKQATDYCAYILHRKNDGFVVLHDAIKSALITRCGWVKVYCEHSWDVRQSYYEGLTDIEVQALQANENLTVDEVVQVQEVQVPVVNGQPGQPNAHPQTFNVRCSIRNKKTNFRVVGVPPEEMWVSKDSRNLNEVRCIGQDTPRTVSELISLGYDPDLVAEIPTGTENDTYGERYEREKYDNSWTTNNYETQDPSQRMVILQECYVRCDFDGDGQAEYRRVVKAGTIIFENDVVDDHAFAFFTPFLMPYKLTGISLYDLVEDLQRIQTAINRQYLDNLYLANTPMRGVVEGMVTLDDLLNPRPGGLVRMKQAGMIQDLAVPDIGPSALSGIQYFQSVRDSRTGIKEFSQGLVGDELSKSNIGSQGVALLHDAAAQRIELIARVLAETGVKRIYKLLLKLICQYQSGPVEARISGQWV